MKRQVFVADANRQKLSNRMGYIEFSKKALRKYLREETKLFPESVYVKIWGVDNHLLISEWIK